MGIHDPPAVAFPRVVQRKSATVNAARFTASADAKVRGIAFRAPVSPFLLSVATVRPADIVRAAGAGGGAPRALAPITPPLPTTTPVDTLYVPRKAAERRAPDCLAAPPIAAGFYFPLEAGDVFEVTLHVVGGPYAAVQQLLSAADKREMCSPRLVARIRVDGTDLGAVVPVGSLGDLPLADQEHTLRGYVTKDGAVGGTGSRPLRVADHPAGAPTTARADAVGTIRVEAYVEWAAPVAVGRAPKRRRMGWTPRRRGAVQARGEPPKEDEAPCGDGGGGSSDCGSTGTDPDYDPRSDALARPWGRQQAAADGRVAATLDVPMEAHSRLVPGLSWTVYHRPRAFFHHHSLTDEAGRPLLVSSRWAQASAITAVTAKAEEGDAGGGGGERDKHPTGTANDDTVIDDEDDDEEVVIVEPGHPGHMAARGRTGAPAGAASETSTAGGLGDRVAPAGGSA
ncbi:hypothetical protein I4F81_000216 [Pyropia yezoensis]|uniref:Uncharacterized protein n=1 Tax=Pyropia yezoensis TaxID=2788 RepID=A0ACC3BIK0_PYRYE|nr:hypothetical protein I4F81_000216 [Neopyropia yezoensis]